jgi:hypothetical protein
MEKKFGVSSSIRSTEMYSCAQCAMQEESVCCRDVPYLIYKEQGLGPSALNTYTPPYLPGYWGFTLLVALNKDGPGQWSGHLQAAQPRTCGPQKMYVNIVLYFPSSNTLFWNAYPNDYQMIVCIVLIVVLFLGLINHIME